MPQTDDEECSAQFSLEEQEEIESYTENGGGNVQPSMVQLPELLSENSPDAVSTEETLTQSSVNKTTIRFFNIVRTSWFIQEMKELIKLALPIFLLYIFQQLLFLLSTVFIGHISDDATILDGGALANSFVNVSGWAVMFGLSSGADTLCPQSYGFGNYKRVGVILQRGIIILAISCLPVIVIWLNSESILLLLQQQPCVVRYASQYLRIFILALPSLVVLTMLQKYLQAQSVVWIFAIIGLIQVTMFVVLTPLLLFVARIGIIGASISLVISLTSSTLILIAYIWFRGLHKKTWGGWSWQSLDEWGQFLKLGVSGFLIVCFEWWSFEISVLVTGSIDEVQLGVNTVLIQIITTTYVLALGVGTAAGIRVGNELGAGNPVQAKRASYTALGIEVVVGLILLVVFLSFRNQIGRVFTRDERVISQTGRAMYGAAGILFTDQIQGTIAGVIRGLGRQPLAAAVNFTVYYVIGLPIGISLALLTDLGTLGMWIGLSIADLLQTIAFTVILFTTNWKKLSEKAVKNARDREHEPVPDDISEDTNSTAASDQLTPELAAMVFAEVDLVAADDDENEELEIEEVPLVSHQDVEELTTTIITETSSSLSVKRTRLRLLLTKGSVFTVGILVLIIGAILAGVFPHGGSLESDCVVNNTCYCNNTSDTFRTLSLTADGFVHRTSISVANTQSSHYQFSSALHQALPTPTPAAVQ